MVNLKESELLKLIEVGIKGNSNAFTLLCRRLVSKIKVENKDFANQLVTMLSENKVARDIVMAPPVDNESRRSLLQEIFPVIIKDEPVWGDNLLRRLSLILKERNHIDALLSEELMPISSLLLSGPPGAGKTLCAHWLAFKLNLPILILDLSTVMSSLLGKTGTNIRSVIDYAKSFPCVLLLDEFDSIAKRRDDDKDVGELKRLVTVLLQSIDDWPATSLLIAATNHPDILDFAVWRRFDQHISFDTPEKKAITSYLNKNGISSDISEKLSVPLEGKSFAIINKMLNTAKKNVVLDNMHFELALLEQILNEDSKIDKKNKELVVLKHHLEGLSNRKIAELLKISHPTVSNILKKLGVK